MNARGSARERMGGTRAPPRGWDQDFSAAIRLMRQLAGMPG